MVRLLVSLAALLLAAPAWGAPLRECQEPPAAFEAIDPIARVAEPEVADGSPYQSGLAEGGDPAEVRDLAQDAYSEDGREDPSVVPLVPLIHLWTIWNRLPSGPRCGDGEAGCYPDTHPALVPLTMALGAVSSVTVLLMAPPSAPRLLPEPPALRALADPPSVFRPPRHA